MSIFSIDVPTWITVRIKAETADDAIALARRLGMQEIEIATEEVNGYEVSDCATAWFDKIPGDCIADEWDETEVEAA